MMRLPACAVSLALSVLSLAASAITLEVLPGSGPQSARMYTYFQNPVGVVVRDDAGVPIANATIQFTFQTSGPESPDVGFMGSGAGFTTSDAQGRAILTDGITAGNFPGDVALFAFYPDHPEVIGVTLPALTTLPDPPTHFEMVSGADQVVQAGQLLAQPWRVRALDAQGLAVPYAFVLFFQSGNEGAATATFDGLGDAVEVMADASGTATAPRARANAIVGQGVDAACGYDTPCLNIYFQVINWPLPAAAQLVGAPPLSMESGTTAFAPFVVRVTNAAGHASGGVPVTFATLPDCGSFGGADRVTVITGANGLATSPLYRGTGDGISCLAWAEIGGSPALTIGLDIFVFLAKNVRIDAPSYVVATTGHSFQVDLAFTAAGNPVYGLPISVQVFAGTNGASASIAHAPIESFGSNVATLKFNANSKAGYYAIAITRGPIREYVVVDQRKH